MMRTEGFRRLCLAVLRILAVAGAYYAGGRIGLLQQVVIEGAVVTPLWPPTGIALACLLRLGLGVWPGIALGTYLVIQTIGPFEPVGVGILAGNTLAPVCACLLLRLAGFRTGLDRLRDGVALVFLGGLVPMLISATVGAGLLRITGSIPASGFWTTWWTWWAGDAMGVLVVTPLLLVLSRARMPRDTYRWAEASALAVTAVAVTLLATRSELALLFLVFPVLIWAALRFQLAGSAPCMLLVSVLANAAAIDLIGPFARHTLTESMVNLQALNGSAALTSLLLSALVTEHINIRMRIEQACQDLAEVVDQLTSARATPRWPPPEVPPGPGDVDGL
ncbi:MASE1 domain-containing protein [Streptomyces sp. NBC_01408]|uniref:MASE1 domain-containing protein n=1 Tax=Streptomyces sp. NBC_01408 TaxID=2903855 RepID=UPI00224D553B|nr:MASE1 domain-containing protein [Streptomyces sp. NBC_01408]MCX4694706.1 MASE1 domain-containing protein [Streptomyces sp. NBC_01408]